MHLLRLLYPATTNAVAQNNITSSCWSIIKSPKRSHWPKSRLSSFCSSGEPSISGLHPKAPMRLLTHGLSSSSRRATECLQTQTSDSTHSSGLTIIQDKLISVSLITPVNAFILFLFKTTDGAMSVVEGPFYFLIFIGVCARACYRACAEVRGQLRGVSFPFHFHMGYRD